MKIRNSEAFIDRISGDLAWRRAELASFHRVIARADGITQNALLRGSVAMLYAHWEGFVKEATYLYLCFLSSRRLAMNKLRPELAALSMRSQLGTALETRNPVFHAEVVRLIRENANERARIPTDRSVVRTESNLSFRVLSAILLSVGLDPTPFEKSRDVIDGELVAVRNRIVHGENETIALTDWVELRDHVVDLMAQVGDRLMNAAVEKSYLSVDA